MKIYDAPSAPENRELVKSAAGHLVNPQFDHVWNHGVLDVDLGNCTIGSKAIKIPVEGKMVDALACCYQKGLIQEALKQSLPQQLPHLVKTLSGKALEALVPRESGCLIGYKNNDGNWQLAPALDSIDILPPPTVNSLLKSL